MSASRAYLERCAADTRFGVTTLEKVVRLGAVAGEIGRHALLGRSLALKGGTALNLAFGEPSRLSVDLDFNYVGAVDRDAMLSERPQVERAVMEIARKLGYRVQRSSDSFAGRKLFLHYSSVLGPEERIEVDLNFLLRVPLAPLTRREL
jgi:predicted nucleotidyltransferase component of viral defense system